VAAGAHLQPSIVCCPTTSHVEHSTHSATMDAYVTRTSRSSIAHNTAANTIQRYARLRLTRNEIRRAFLRSIKACYFHGSRLLGLDQDPRERHMRVALSLVSPIDTQAWFVQIYGAEAPPLENPREMRKWKAQKEKRRLERFKCARRNWHKLIRCAQMVTARLLPSPAYGGACDEQFGGSDMDVDPSRAPAPSPAPAAAVGITPTVGGAAEPRQLDRSHPALAKVDKALVDSVLGIQGKPQEVTFEQIIGVKNAKEDANDAIDAMLHSEEGSIPSGMLLLGPPGTGKSMLADAIATAVGNCSVFTVKQDWLQGNEVKKITAVFAVASAMAPSIIFINECDAIMRGSPQAKYINHFKDTWVNSPNSPVLVMGNTNNPELIDKALRSRFTTEIQFKPPDAESRKVILRNEFEAKGLTCEINECEWDAIAAATDGKVGRDLSLGLVDRVARKYNSQHRGKKEKPPITTKDIVEKLSEDEAKIVRNAIRAPGPSGKRPASVRPEDEGGTSSTRKRKQRESSSAFVAAVAAPPAAPSATVTADDSEEDQPLTSRGGKPPVTSGDKGSSRKRKERESSSVVADATDAAQLKTALRILYPTPESAIHKFRIDIFKALDESDDSTVRQGWKSLGDQEVRKQVLDPKRSNNAASEMLHAAMLAVHGLKFGNYKANAKGEQSGMMVLDKNGSFPS